MLRNEKLQQPGVANNIARNDKQQFSLFRPEIDNPLDRHGSSRPALQRQV
jgi:hypothetical protein